MYNPYVTGAYPNMAPPATNATGATMDNGSVVVVDGTPIRVVILALSAAAGLTILKWAGFKFNVGVSN